jgi:hypothetical protein
MKTPIAADEAPIAADKPLWMSYANIDPNLRHPSPIGSHITHPSAEIGVSKAFCVRQPRSTCHE